MNNTRKRLLPPECYDTEKISGIYKIINKINGHYYVGSSKNFHGSYGRIASHIRRLIKNKHGNDYLQRAWNKYGQSNFEFRLIEPVEPIKSTLYMVEQKYLDIAKIDHERGVCYNLKFIVGGGEMSEYSKQKIRTALTGRKATEEAKRNLSIALTGREFSEEHRQNLSIKGKSRNPLIYKLIGNKLRGRKMTDEQKLKHSVAIKKSMTPERKKHLSLLALKRFENPLERERMSKLHMGKPVSAETRQKMSNTLKGRVFSKTHLEKLTLPPISAQNINTNEIKSMTRKEWLVNHKVRFRDGYNSKGWKLLI